MLLLGRIGDRIGNYKVYLGGFLIFTAGSLFCGLIGSLTLLLIGRAIQALGAAMLFATGLGIIATTFPITQRGQALGVNVIAVGLGSMCGPSIGGFILSHFSWHYIFYINIPVGLLGLILGLKYLRSPIPTEKSTLQALDGWGALLLAILISSFILALAGGFAGSAWFLLIAAVVLPYFILHERRHEAPLWDFALLQNKRFAFGNIIAFSSYFAHMFVFFLMPFYMTDILQLSTATMGLVIMGAPALMAITSPISGTLSDKIGALRLMPYALLIILAAQITFSLLQPDSSLWHVAAGLMLLGGGMGFLNSPNNSEIMTAAGTKYAGYAGSFVSTTRNLAFCLGTAAAAGAFTILRTFFERSQEATAAYISAFHWIIIAAGCITCINLIICLWLKRFQNEDISR
jgi:EmrB/QacA subfamily drug resistance transporter